MPRKRIGRAARARRRGLGAVVARETPSADADVVIVDSYRLEPETVVAATAPLVVFRDHSDVGPMPSLVVSVAAPPSDDPRWLCGPRYAAVRPSYWGLPPKDVSGPVRRCS